VVERDLFPSATRHTAAGRPAALDLFIGDDAAFHGIDQKHLPRLKAAFRLDSLSRRLAMQYVRSEKDFGLRDIVLTPQVN